MQLIRPKNKFNNLSKGKELEGKGETAMSDGREAKEAVANMRKCVSALRFAAVILERVVKEEESPISVSEIYHNITHGDLFRLKGIQKAVSKVSDSMIRNRNILVKDFNETHEYHDTQDAVQSVAYYVITNTLKNSDEHTDATDKAKE